MASLEELIKMIDSCLQREPDLSLFEIRMDFKEMKDILVYLRELQARRAQASYYNERDHKTAWEQHQKQRQAEEEMRRRNEEARRRAEDVFRGFSKQWQESFYSSDFEELFRERSRKSREGEETYTWEEPTKAKRPWTTVLGVDGGATRDEIMKAYRRLAQKLHPDKAGGSKEAFQELQEAKRTALGE